MNFNFISFTDIGLKRTGNEDACGVFEIENGLLSIVCDGLGGNKAGDVASSLAVKIIADSFSASDERDYLERIKTAILEANRAILSQSDRNFENKGMATTVEVLYLKDNTSYWGHVGDSRIYNLRNGKLKQITKDHSLVQKLVDDGFLTHKEAENHPNKNIILRALGDNKLIEIDLSKLKFKLEENNSFFMCTDGVSGVVQDNELEQLLNFTPMDLIPGALSEMIMERGAPDNFTFVNITVS